MEKNNFFENGTSSFQGLLAIVFGVVVVAYPDLSVSFLATFFGILLLIGGAILSTAAYMKKDFKKYGKLNFILGILSVVLAIVILSYPKEAVAAFLLLSVGVWAIITGGILIWAYTHMPKDKKHRTVTLVFGIASLLFGLFIALKPIESTYGVAILVGIYAIFYGLHSLFYPAQKS